MKNTHTTFNRFGFNVTAMLVLTFAMINAQVGSAEEPKQGKKAYAEWVVSYSDAVKQSEASGRPIMLVFTGSDWCHWCTKLSDDVFATHEFARWSTDNVIKVEVDFPNLYDLPESMASQNEVLKAKYADHVTSYPTVLFVNAGGDVLGTTGYVAGGPNAWIEDASPMINPEKAKQYLAQSGN